MLVTLVYPVEISNNSLLFVCLTKKNIYIRVWKNYNVYKIRLLPPEEGLEACSGVCGYISSWCF